MGWGECESQELDCGLTLPDAGTPPAQTGCGCIPGSVIKCDDDCSTGIFCILTAEKVCLPDGTWSVCRETGRQPPPLWSPLPDGGMPSMEQIQAMAAAEAQRRAHECWSHYFGCEGSQLSPVGVGETFTGDCGQYFTCGQAPATVLPGAKP